MNFPENVKYHIEHTWINVDGEIGIIGITDFAQKELGEIVYIDLPNVGSSFDQDEIFGSVEAIKTVSDLFMPVSGKILEINNNLLKNPTLVNSDPFSQGWMIKIQLTNVSEIENLINNQDYKTRTSA
ncbi:glycine cleavage system protein GcvH [Flavobacterium sp. ZE23DGlu08]|jgi:glycine cleavage system H protein|uniref:glycine cleavage system protein GcvH n=1 Tax=Flavobacterium sp. ZE23DGlu08 TaxID=3059026 RepID=UPI00265ED29A|nr:glycine cleavage system protein GcvH [Flavobacterium sp. ZE23DGlu08]WKL44305.1 glycine cleavage system protein GcvH [Flavobacterium sp. ZE23DGlu08]